MGNAGAKSELRVYTYAGSYRPGEEVTGTVSLYLAKKSLQLGLDLEIVGEESYCVAGLEQANRRERTFNYRAVLFDSELDKGAYEFPFAIRLPTSLSSSFSLQTKSFAAGVSYYIRTSLPQASLVSTVQLNIINSSPISPPIVVEETYPLTCCCFNSDFIRVSACLDQGEYSSSDDVLVTIGVDTLGASQGVRAIRLELVQITRLRRGNNANAMCFSQVVLDSEIPKQMHAHTICTEGNALQALLSLQSTAVAGATHGAIVESGLRIDVKVRTERGQELLLSLPLVVRNRACAEAYSPPLPSDWKPVVMSTTRLVQRSAQPFAFPSR